MTTFEPGRVYSGIVDGKRRLLFRDDDHWHWIEEGDLMGGYNANRRVTDVRGPLVVLDLDQLNEDEGYEFPVQTIVESMRDEQTITGRWIADQIEEQTKPPLQIGWHEVEGNAMPRYWNGSEWMLAPTNVMPTAQDWTSTHYIGPGSDQS